MMGRRFRALMLATVCMVLAACCSAPAAPLRLELKLEKGKTYYQKTTTDQRITQTVMGMEQVITQSVGNGLKLDVLDVDGQGNMRIRHTLIWLMSRQQNPMGSMEYDSAKQAAPPAGSDPLAALVGQSYVLTLSPKGKVLKVEGVKELKAAVDKVLPVGGQPSQTAAIAGSYVDEQKVKEMTEATLAFYPDKPVEQGDSWTEKMTLTAVFGLVVDHKWTLQKLEGGAVTIGETVAIQSDPNAPPMDMQGMKMYFDLSGAQEGTLRVDAANGLLLTSQARQQLKGNIKVIMPQGMEPMSIPAVFDTTIKVETSDTMWKTDAQ